MKLVSTMSLSLITLLALVACNAAQPAPISRTGTSSIISNTQKPSATSISLPLATVTPTYTMAFILMPTNTMTSISSSTPTHTQTITRLPSSTATMAPSETPSRKPPGIYNTGNCVSYVYGDFLHVEFCVQSVEILYDYSMVFTVSWSIQYSQGVTPSPDNPVHKGSDYNNRNMYIIDNLGNRYDHFTAGGGASGAIVTHGDYLVGTFTFPPAVPGAYIFTFYDDDQGVHTHGIELTTPIKLYENLVLAYSPFTLRYPLQHWQSGVNEDGNGILTHLKIPNCVIFEAPPSVPHGALINTIDIGLTTYQIFRYYEQDFSVREYLAIKNPDEINLDEQPHLNAHIPYDDSIVCLTDVGEVLAHLETKSTTNP